MAALNPAFSVYFIKLCVGKILKVFFLVWQWVQTFLLLIFVAVARQAVEACTIEATEEYPTTTEEESCLTAKLPG